MPRKVRQGRTEGEYRFKIDAYTPAKFPMARLAEYMHQLALILGEPAQVHFRKLVRGSTVIVHEIEREAVPKVMDRVDGVRRGDGPSEALRAYKAANRMLREDNAVGSLKNGRVILPFPGKDEVREEYAVVRQHGFVDGVITGVRGRDQTAHIILQAEDRQIAGCWTSRVIAKQLGGMLWEPVRLYGRGRWKRDDEGVWELIDFKVESFDPLNDTPLSAALADLRKVPTEWGDNAYQELGMIRHGPRANGNGSR